MLLQRFETKGHTKTVSDIMIENKTAGPKKKQNVLAQQMTQLYQTDTGDLSTNPYCQNNNKTESSIELPSAPRTASS